jgi:hypothetical protein
MTRRFVIGVEGLGDAENARLKGYLDSWGSWWHWIPNFWLLVTDDPGVSAEALRDYITSLNKEVRSIVFEFEEDITWAGKGPTAEGKNMFNWLRRNWNKQRVED